MINLDRFKLRVWYKNYKFEGKPTKESRMVYLEDEFFCYENINAICNDAKKSKAVLMQCTGLFDKNNKLIYEGDILKALLYDLETGELCDEDDARYVVAFRYGCFGLAYNKNLKDFEPFGTSEDEIKCCKYEVIGNIYENANLINN